MPPSSSTVTGVPIVDLAPWLAGDAPGKALVAEQVRDACEEIGFFSVVGHGVPPDLVSACRAVARAFFDQPVDEKVPVAAHRPGAFRGYVPLGRAAVAYSMGKESPPDLREVFAMGPVDVDRRDPYFSGEQAGNHFAPNIWPAAIPTLEAVLTDYFRALDDLARTLMRVFAVALDRPEDFFEPFIDRSISMLEALNYPDLVEPPLPGQLRVGEHSDYGSLTILLHDDAPGNLQVRTKDGSWADVAAVPGGFVVNLGDLMAQWTNDRWVSTVHRVVPPPLELLGQSRRLAIAFFHQPNYDALISCLDGVRGEGEAAKHPPETSGDHLRRKIAGIQEPGGQSERGTAGG
ncbi:MAG: 2OG-Fe(II) oxygenase family protein [Acidimicrobiales bacterium]|nr:2OG-Fe(II) oxygenase family protein [Acidimicrobiales bacterium]